MSLGLEREPSQDNLHFILWVGLLPSAARARPHVSLSI